MSDAEKRSEARLRNAIEEWSLAEESLSSAEIALGAARENLRFSEESFRSGAASQVDWLKAVFVYEASKDTRNEAVATCLLAQVNLSHALGKMERLLPESASMKGEK